MLSKKLRLRKEILLFVSLFVFIILPLVNAQTQWNSFVSSNPQYIQPSFSSYYSSQLYSGSGAQYQVYWPSITGAENCSARTDFIVQIAPAGCTPTVVRSDLLAEQNVPVFCQLNAVKINPLIDVKAIDTISITNKEYPKEIAGVGFHPAQAALRTTSTLLGSPVMNNIGYVVIVLKKTSEKNMSDWVSGNLSAYIQYNIDRAYGIGKQEFFVPVLNDGEWGSRYKEFSFWDGKGFLKVDGIDGENVGVSIYSSENTKVSSVIVKRGDLSKDIYLPGFYCRAGLQIRLNNLELPQTYVKLQVDNDVLELTKGQSFLDGKCSVVNIDSYGAYGSAEISCGGNFNLELRPSDVTLSVGGLEKKYAVGEKLNENTYLVYAGELPKSVEKTGERFFVVLGSSYDESVKRDVVNKLKSFDSKKKDSVKFDDFKKVWGSNFEIVLKGQEGIRIGKGVNFKDLVEVDKTYTGNTEQYFTKSVESYESVADKYHAETNQLNVKESGFIGDTALSQAENLAQTLGKTKTLADIYAKHIEAYPNDGGKDAKTKLEELSGRNIGQANNVVYIDQLPHVINLLDIINPGYDEAGIIVDYEDRYPGNEKYKLASEVFQKGDYIRQASAQDARKGSVKIDNFDANSVNISYECTKKDTTGKEETEKGTKEVRKGESISFCSEIVSIRDIKYKQYARISLIPKAYNQVATANFSFKVGIEKRAITLTPEKTKEMISNLDKSIKQWDSIVANLGGVVSGMKAGCLATAGVLTVKNLIEGFSGQATARQQVMKAWRANCTEAVSKGEYSNEDKCYASNSDKINDDVKAWTEIMNKENTKIQGIEKDITKSVFLGESIVDTRKSGDGFFNALSCGDTSVKSDDGKTSSQILTDLKNKAPLVDEKNPQGARLNPYEAGMITYDEMKSISMDCQILGGSATDTMKKYSADDLKTILNSVTGRNNDETAKNGIAETLGVKIPISRDPNKKSETLDVGSATWEKVKTQITIPGTLDLSKINDNQHVEFVMVGEDTVMNILQSDSSGKQFNIVGSYLVEKKDSAVNIVGKYTKSLNWIAYTKFDATTYKNTYKNPKVRFFGTDPYKGMPAIVPFDKENGWYAATKQTLPIVGNAKSFDASGKVSTFWVCNVGKNGLEQFNEGLGDDVCRQINLEAGQPVDIFPGLSQSDAKRITGNAITALEQAATQSSQTKVKILGQMYDVGEPAANVAGTECQDFMSPGECTLLFNVCDPVICPSSRCNLGGEYYVSNVIQSGIIGSIVLCLPNFGNPANGGVVVPLCLSGIHAGLQSYVSILKAEQSCLNESLTTGNYVGICDQLTAVYLCDFFWRQFAPLMNNLIPRIIQWASGAGTTGGGEYANVMDAWNNAQSSVSYLTDYYGKNSMTAFQTRSTEEVGVDVCKTFLSTKYPTSFKNMIQPDSPTQFIAWFEEIPFTSATVPATSQYKVFYHIYAGNDSGNYYSVYLKRTSQEPFYNTPIIYTVENGYVPVAGVISQSKDFTAPAGYSQLCVRVGLQEECGFKQVTTSFALDYMSDKYVQGQATQTNISSDKECVSGTTSLYPSGLSSLGGVAEQTVTSQIYEKGIVRLCSTRNPGEGTEPERWVKVGHCDDENVGCWIDEKSVTEAINSGASGILNQTLSELNNTALKEAELQGYSEDNINKNLTKIEEKIGEIGNLDKIIAMTSDEIYNLISETETLELKSVYAYQKAKALFLRAEIYDKLTVIEKFNFVLRNLQAQNQQAAATAAKPAATKTEIPVTLNINQLDQIRSYVNEHKSFYIEALEPAWNSYDKAFFYYDNTKKEWLMDVTGLLGAKGDPLKNYGSLYFLNSEIKTAAAFILKTEEKLQQSNSQKTPGALV